MPSTRQNRFQRDKSSNDLNTMIKDISIKSKSKFENIGIAPPDPTMALFEQYKNDSSEDAVNVSLGCYCDEQGEQWVLPVVKKAKEAIANDPNDSHEYLNASGFEEFVTAAKRLMFGNDQSLLDQIASVQTHGGTGALYIGGKFLERNNKADIYIPMQTYGKLIYSVLFQAMHRQIFEFSGLPVKKYPYFDSLSLGLDFQGMINCLKEAANGSIILLHAVAHNPTGVDPTIEQWKQIADVIVEKEHYPFFDCAYQGFASADVDKDVQSIRYFCERKIDIIVAQSFSKNFGLYGERIGCLSVACSNSQICSNVLSELSFIMASVSDGASTFGAKIVSRVLLDDTLTAQWKDNLRQMSNRISQIRNLLHQELITLKTPGKWDHIVKQVGMFTLSGLSSSQCIQLRNEYHIYLTESGRIALPGLNLNNYKYVAKSIDRVVRDQDEKIKCLS